MRIVRIPQNFSEAKFVYRQQSLLLGPVHSSREYSDRAYHTRPAPFCTLARSVHRTPRTRRANTRSAFGPFREFSPSNPRRSCACAPTATVRRNSARGASTYYATRRRNRTTKLPGVGFFAQKQVKSGLKFAGIRLGTLHLNTMANQRTLVSNCKQERSSLIQRK